MSMSTTVIPLTIEGPPPPPPNGYPPRRSYPFRTDLSSSAVDFDNGISQLKSSHDDAENGDMADNHASDDHRKDVNGPTQQHPSLNVIRPQQHLQDFSRRLPPLSIDECDYDEEFDDELHREPYLNRNDTSPTKRRRMTMISGTHYFRLPSVRLPSRQSANRSKSWGYWICPTVFASCPTSTTSLVSCLGLIVLSLLIGYVSEKRGDYKDQSFIGAGGKNGGVWKTETTMKGKPENSKLWPYDVNFKPSIGNDYSNVTSLNDLFELAGRVSVQCLYNQSSCPCQQQMGTLPSSSTTTNSRLLPKTGTLDGWETAFTWNVQTASSVRGTKSNIVFLGDSITELWRGTRLGQSLHSTGDADIIARTFDHLFQTTVLETTQQDESYDDSVDRSNDDDHEEGDDDDPSDGGITDVVKDSNRSPNNAGEEFSPGEISLRSVPFGIAGDQSINLLWRMQNGELPTNLNPSVFVVLIGTNDLSYDQCSAENVVIGILRCVEYILAERPNATVLLHGLLPRTLDKKGYLVPSGFSKSEHDNRSSSSLKVPYVWSHIKIVNAELERYANHRRSVEYFDPSDIFLKSRKQIDFDLMPDGTHPSKNGYELWGKQLQTKIVRMINESL